METVPLVVHMSLETKHRHHFGELLPQVRALTTEGLEVTVVPGPLIFPNVGDHFFPR